jgi:hypothetical protein
MLITNINAGYPNPNFYSINLKNNFTNVVRIELTSTEIPQIDNLIKTNINDKLYWKHYDDGNVIYEATIAEGNYTADTIIVAIQDALNNVKRINSTTENPIYNIFNVSINSFSNEVIFYAFKNNNLPNSLSISTIIINNIKYVKLTIQHENNLVDIGDNIIISNADDIGIISNKYINKTHIVYDINITNQSYIVLIDQLNQITNSTEVNFDGNGGASTVIQTKAKVSFLFNKSDTIGEVLGFKNVGSSNAITTYSNKISNFDNYTFYTDKNSVGDIDTKAKILNFTGDNLYILMYINDYECVINNSNQLTAFAKILLSGNTGDMLFNTFINYPLEFDFPISTLNELIIKFTYPDGSLVDFRNINHSFTLLITEKITMLNNTGINSKDTNYYEETINHKFNN